MLQSRYEQRSSLVLPVSCISSAIQSDTENGNEDSIPTVRATPVPVNSGHTAAHPIVALGRENSRHIRQQLVQYTGDHSVHSSWMRSRRMDNESNALNRWRDSLFNCLSQIYPSCVCSFTFPCIVVGNITAKIKFMPFIFSFAVVIMLYMLAALLCITTGGVGGAVLTWVFLSFFVCTIRKKIRLQHNFSIGTDSEDFFSACCCMWCVIAQMARHIFRYRFVLDFNHPIIYTQQNAARRNENSAVLRREFDSYPQADVSSTVPAIAQVCNVEQHTLGEQQVRCV